MNIQASQQNLILASTYALDQLHVGRGGVLELNDTSTKATAESLVNVITQLTQDLKSLSNNRIFAPPQTVTDRLTKKIVSQYKHLRSFENTKEARLFKDFLKIEDGSKSAFDTAMSGLIMALPEHK